MKWKKQLLSLLLLITLAYCNAQNVSIPDSNFKAYLLSNPLINTNGDTEISLSEATSFTGEINCKSLNIKTMSGLASFTNLTRLICNNNSLNTLDISANNQLSKLVCNTNNISNLNLSNNPLLTYLKCSENKLTELSTFNNPLISSLYCFKNNISNLDISSSIHLKYLQCQENILTSIDISNNSLLVTFYCYKNALTLLDIHSNTNLKTLRCYANNITVLDTYNNRLLENLYCYQNNIQQLDLQLNINLSNLRCYKNKITLLDVSKNLKLTKLYCQNNKLTSLNIQQNLLLEDLRCNENNLNSLDLTKNSQLLTLYCNTNNLTNLNIYYNGALKELRCYKNELNTLDIRQNKQLEKLLCNDNSLTNLDTYSNTSLKDLRCHNNSLKSLNLSQNSALTTLYCYSNNLDQLDISNNTFLKVLRCQYNSIKNLTVHKNPLLSILYCYDNVLDTIDLDNNPLLKSLRCQNNNISSINISKNVLLETLYCYNNLISSLDLRQHSSLKYLKSSTNNLQSLYLQNGSNNLLSILETGNNPLLKCILIDNAIIGIHSNWKKDLTTMFVDSFSIDFDTPSLAIISKQCEITKLTPPTASNNCGKYTLKHNAQLPITSQGTHFITWTYILEAGFSYQQTQELRVNDTIAPVPDMPQLPSITAACSISNLTAPTATDACSGIIIGTHNVVLPINTQGTTNIIWTFEDDNGNKKLQIQEINLIDTIAPVPDMPQLPNISATCSISNLTAPTATDTCSGIITGTHNAVLPINTQGTTNIVWTFEDDNGNKKLQIQEINLIDTIPPVPHMPQLPSITATCSISNLTAPTATDACSGIIIGTYNDVLPINTQGTTNIVWTFEDDNGNKKLQIQEINLIDTIAPVPDMPQLPSISATCSISNLTAPTATDACSGIIIGTHNAVLPINTQGTTNIVWTFEDDNGNKKLQIQEINLIDTIPPVPDMPQLPSITATCSISNLTAPTATDACSGIITGTHNAVLPINTQGTTNIIWTFEDDNGNKKLQIQEINLADTIPPVPDMPQLPSITATCSISNLTAPTATDACSGIITGTHNAVLPINTQGTTNIVWTFEDDNGNKKLQIQEINLIDTIPPVPDMPQLPSITATCSISNLTAPTATDACSGIITGTHNAVLPINTQGTTYIIWTFEDNNGNKKLQIQEINLIDTIAPIPDMPQLPSITATCSISNLTAPTATDACSGIITGTHNAVLPINTQGTTNIVWTFEDDNGNKKLQIQEINLIDTIAPVPDMPQLPSITAACSISNLTAPTATDACSGIITGTHNTVLPINTQGTTNIMWTFEDDNGNKKLQIQEINLIDTIAPVPDMPQLPSITATCSISNLTAPTATDTCSGIITGTHNAVLPINTQGTTNIVWTFEDDNGNKKLQIQEINLIDTIPPVPDELFLDILTIPINTSIPIPTATDNCNGNIIGISSHPSVFSKVNSYAIEWNYIDSHGNSSSQTQEIIVTNTPAAPLNNYITPNNDGVNDYWIVNGIHEYTKNSLRIFSRTGKIVYKQINMNNHWDGYSNIKSKKRVLRGVYFYILTFYLEKKAQKVGWIYVDY